MTCFNRPVFFTLHTLVQLDFVDMNGNLLDTRPLDKAMFIQKLASRSESSACATAKSIIESPYCASFPPNGREGRDMAFTRGWAKSHGISTKFSGHSHGLERFEINVDKDRWVDAWLEEVPFTFTDVPGNEKDFLLDYGNKGLKLAYLEYGTMTDLLVAKIGRAHV